jgi:hypothetical protein
MSTCNWEEYGGVRFLKDEGHHDVMCGGCEDVEVRDCHIESDTGDPLAYIKQRIQELKEARLKKESKC